MTVVQATQAWLARGVEAPSQASKGPMASTDEVRRKAQKPAATLRDALDVLEVRHVGFVTPARCTFVEMLLAKLAASSCGECDVD